MGQRTFTRSFAAGELSPQLFGRLDLAKYQTGLAKCLNFVVTAQGPVHNRAGFEYILQAKTPGAVLIPFSYNSQQTYVLEIGAGYIRFHTLGATLLESAKAISAISQADPGVFTSAGHGYATGDWVFLSSVGGMTALSGRWAMVAGATTDTFTLTDLFGAAISTVGMPAYTGAGTVSRVYEIVSPYNAADLFDLHYVQSADVLTICHQGYAPRELRRTGPTNWQLSTVSFQSAVTVPAVPIPAASGTAGTGVPGHYTYCLTAVQDGTLQESLQSPSASEDQQLSVEGNSIFVQAQATPASIGAAKINVYKLRGVFGYIGSIAADQNTLIDDNILPDTSKTPPLQDNPFVTDFPRAVSYFEQRRCFGGSTALPQTMWLTRSGTESNMNYTIPTQDDDRIVARIVAREANTIRHFVPLGDLLALTSGGVWRISSADGGALTPATMSVKPQGYAGASNVQPIVTSSSVLYAPDRGAHIREVAYKWETQNYQSEDVAVLAPHLFDYQSIVQLAYSKTPHQILWAVRGDGKLLGLTHVPEHEVKAWHQHDTQGSFKSVCAVSEGEEDGLYAIVERTIGGRVVQYIERMHSRKFAQLADAFFVDAGAAYSGPSIRTITGLWHLEGEQVAILADGATEPPKTVVNGTITLEQPASTVRVGLPYNCDFQTMPLAFEAMQALGQGVAKNVNQVMLRVDQSSGVSVGPDFETLREYAQRTAQDVPGQAPAMVTGVIRVRPDPSWQDNGQVCLRQADPLPLTIESITLDCAAGG